MGRYDIKGRRTYDFGKGDEKLKKIFKNKTLLDIPKDHFQD